MTTFDARIMRAWSARRTFHSKRRVRGVTCFSSSPTSFHVVIVIVRRAVFPSKRNNALRVRLNGHQRSPGSAIRVFRALPFSLRATIE